MQLVYEPIALACIAVKALLNFLRYARPALWMDHSII